MIHALADTSHFAEDGGWFEVGDDEFLRARCSEGLYPPLFEQKQDLTGLTRVEEHVSGPKVSNLAALFERLHASRRQVFEQICRRERRCLDEALGSLGSPLTHTGSSRALGGGFKPANVSKITQSLWTLGGRTASNRVMQGQWWRRTVVNDPDGPLVMEAL